MRRGVIAWIMIIAMLMTQGGVSTFAMNLNNQNNESFGATEESIGASENSVGASSASPEEDSVGASENGVGASEDSVGATENGVGASSASPNEDGVEANEEETTTVGASSASPENESETLDDANNANPEEEPEEEAETTMSEEETSVGSNEEETTVEASTTSPEEEMVEKLSSPSQAQDLDLEPVDQDIQKWHDSDTINIWYMNDFGDYYADYGWYYPTTGQFNPRKWYVDGEEVECWYPGGESVGLNQEEDEYIHKFKYNTARWDLNFSQTPYRMWGDYSKQYAFYSGLIYKYFILIGWTKDADKSAPWKTDGNYNKVQYFPGMEYTGVFNDDGSNVRLHPVWQIVDSLPGEKKEYENNREVVIEFWQSYGYWPAHKENNNDPNFFGPYSTQDQYAKFEDNNGKEGYIQNKNNPKNNTNPKEYYWAFPLDRWDELDDEIKSRTQFQTITGKVENKKFSATIPGNTSYTYYGSFSNWSGKEILGFSPAREAKSPTYKIGETYDYILNDAVIENGQYVVRLFPVYAQPSGYGSEVKIKFEMDDRFGYFKNGKTYEYGLNTQEKDFYIPTEDDISFDSVSESWQSNWMLWGWSHYKHHYFLGETDSSGTVITLDNENFSNTEYFSNGNNNFLKEKFANPIDDDTILNEFRAFKSPLSAAQENIIYHPVFVRRPKLRFEIRDKYEWQNDSSGEPKNLVTIKNGSNGGQYIEYKYGDPNTKVPELEYDKTKYMHFEKSWSNYHFANDYVRGDGRPLPVQRRENDMEKFVKMWREKTFEDEKFPLRDNYNNMGWLTMDFDVGGDGTRYTDKYGYDEIPSSETLNEYYIHKSTTKEYFTYYPILNEYKRIIKLQFDKDSGHDLATIDESLPWKDKMTYLEHRRIEDVGGHIEDLDSYYLNETVVREYVHASPTLFYAATPSQIFEDVPYNLDEYKITYYSFKGPAQGFDYSDPVFKQRALYAYDKKGEIAYDAVGMIWDTIDGPLTTLSKTVEDLCGEGKIREDGYLKVRPAFKTKALHPYYRYYDAAEPTKQIGNLHLDIDSLESHFAASVSEVENELLNRRGLNSYEQTNQGSQDNKNGVTVSLNRVEIDAGSIEDGRICLVNPIIRVYLNRIKKAQLTFDIDKTNVKEVKGKEIYFDDEDNISTPSLVMKDEWVFDGWSINGTDVVDDATLKEYIDNWKNSTEENKPDITITAIIRNTPYPIYTVNFLQVANMTYGSNYSTYKTQTVKKYIGEGTKPEANANTAYILDSFKIVGNGVGSPSIAFPLSAFDANGKFKIDDSVDSIVASDNVLNFVPVLTKKNYTVEFRRDENSRLTYDGANAEGKVILNNIQIGDTITAPNTTVASGYKLVSSKALYNNNAYSEKPFPKTLTLDLITKNGVNANSVDTIIIIPVVEEYSLRFVVDPNGKASPSVTGTTAYTSSTNKTSVVPPTVTSNDKRYVFDKWEDSNGTVVNNTDIQDSFENWKNSNPTDDISFHPLFRDSYTFTFVVNETAFELAANQQLVFYESELSNLKTPSFTERNDYITREWVDESKNPVVIADMITEWKNDVTNQTNLKNVKYTITYRTVKKLKYVISQDYATVDTSAKMEYNSKEVGHINIPSFTRKTGYRFENWKDKNNNIIYDPTGWNGNDDVELIAQFAKIRVISFNVDPKYHDASQVKPSDPTNTTFDEDDATITPPKVYPKTGYIGSGWSTKQNPKPNEIITLADIANFIDDWKHNNEPSVVLYFVFEEDPSINKIKFEVDGNYGTYVGSSQFFIDQATFDNEKANISVNVKSGYKFLSWENSNDRTDTYDKAEDIIWDGTTNVVYRAKFQRVNNTPSKPSNSGRRSESSGEVTSPPAGFNPAGPQEPGTPQNPAARIDPLNPLNPIDPLNPLNPLNPLQPQNPQPNNSSDMTPEEKFNNPPAEEFVVVNMNKYNPDRADNDSSSDSDSDSGQSFLWETEDRVEWRLIQMDNIIENIDYAKTPEWDVVKAFFTQNCKFYEDGWVFLQYRNTYEWYHFAPNSIMDTGWFAQNGNIYYLQTDYNTTFGSMYTGIREIDGITYEFDKTGRLLRIVGIQQ